jgi:hypothetical protein
MRQESALLLIFVFEAGTCRGFHQALLRITAGKRMHTTFCLHVEKQTHRVRRTFGALWFV